MSVMDTPRATEDAPVFTEQHRERLAELEETIGSNLQAFLRVGRALEEIRHERLYLLTHVSFAQYVEARWQLSGPRGWSLAYSAQVADVLEAAGERVEGTETALREFHPVLHQNGPEATVKAFREVTEGGALPSAPKVREKLVRAGVVVAPKRSLVDTMQIRIAYLEKTLPKIEPHPKLAPLLAGYAVRARQIADRFDELAQHGVPRVGPGELCTFHATAPRGSDGLCSHCRRRDVKR